MKNIIVITGPTAVGKTKLSIELAKKIDGEIVNADSMQFYKGLDIGTAKVREDEKENIPHHLFDIKDINEMYTIYDYQKDARKVIDDILKRNKKVIIVGGSGLYIRALLYDYELEEENNQNTYDEYTNEELYNLAKEKDINNDIHVNNRKRLIRFLNQNKKGSNAKKLYDFSIIGLTTSRDILYDKINKRVECMFDDGLLDEVSKYKNDFNTSKALKTGIGYKELLDYFENKKTLDEVKEDIKKNSRHYAKRQYTFFNHQFDLKWFNTNYEDFSKTIDEVYNYLKEE